MHKPKILFFDIDGTLIDMQKKCITPLMLSTLHKLQANGIRLAIATGRSPMTVPLEEFPGVQFDVFITFNGSYCYDKDRVLFASPIPTEDIRTLRRALEQAGAGQIHFVDEDKRWDMISPQQPPERFGVALHAIGTADHQHGIIQNLQSALGLGGKIHMAGSVQQSDIRTACRQQCLLGKNSDPTGFFQCVCVQKGVLVIHSSGFPDLACFI